MNLTFTDYTLLTPKEHLDLLEIRNMEYIRQNMKNSNVIEENDHFRWVDTLKENNSKIYYALFWNQKLIGGINITDIDWVNKNASWGLFMKTNTNPMVPSMATYLIIEKVFHILGMEILNLEVNKLNQNAYKFDKNFGFIDKGEYSDKENSYYLMHMTKQIWEQSKNNNLLKIIKNQINKTDIKFNEQEKSWI
jgi:UDP-4-amino-4,6-dideoxy-N-acetyl-beta-L-altrosamine N-acetyltransferase